MDAPEDLVQDGDPRGGSPASEPLLGQDPLFSREGAAAHLVDRGMNLRMALAGAALGAPVLAGALVLPGLMSGELTDAGALALRFGTGVVLALGIVAVFSQLLSKRSAPELLSTVREGTRVDGRVVGREDSGGAVVEAEDGRRWVAQGEAEADSGAPAVVWTSGEHVAISLAGGVWPGRPA
jgi:hypothetical protein